jgi:restriction endonuclease S subunit
MIKNKAIPFPLLVEQKEIISRLESIFSKEERAKEILNGLAMKSKT